MLDMTVIYDLAIVALRILMPVYAIIIVYQCYAAMRRRRRPEKPLVTLYNTVTGLKLPVIFWENSIGRSRASDIVVDDPAVSRNHCVLLRRASGWYICDTGSKGGTYVNGEELWAEPECLLTMLSVWAIRSFSFCVAKIMTKISVTVGFLRKPTTSLQ